MPSAPGLSILRKLILAPKRRANLTDSKSVLNNGVLISIDVEWAHPEVLADLTRLLDERGIRATFFCTHEGVDVPGHERALHPNFRRERNTVAAKAGAPMHEDSAFYRSIVSATRKFCPEAVGVRSHSLFTDSDLLPVYRDAGLEYDSSYMLPLTSGLAPVWKGSGILEIPVYYMDHWDLKERATALTVADLRLDRPGLKVVIFHPNLVYLNASSIQDMENSRSFYHDAEWLLDHRSTGTGIRTLFLELLDELARGQLPNPVMSDVNSDWRATN